VLGRDFVIGAGDFHEAVAPDFAAAFVQRQLKMVLGDN
jgi:hypothetical protein